MAYLLHWTPSWTPCWLCRRRDSTGAWSVPPLLIQDIIHIIPRRSIYLGFWIINILNIIIYVLQALLYLFYVTQILEHIYVYGHLFVAILWTLIQTSQVHKLPLAVQGTRWNTWHRALHRLHVRTVCIAVFSRRHGRLQICIRSDWYMQYAWSFVDTHILYHIYIYICSEYDIPAAHDPVCMPTRRRSRKSGLCRIRNCEVTASCRWRDMFAISATCCPPLRRGSPLTTMYASPIVSTWGQHITPYNYVTNQLGNMSIMVLLWRCGSRMKTDGHAKATKKKSEQNSIVIDVSLLRWTRDNW